jgi:hypothetical protein
MQAAWKTLGRVSLVGCLLVGTVGCGESGTRPACSTPPDSSASAQRNPPPIPPHLIHPGAAAQGEKTAPGPIVGPGSPASSETSGPVVREKAVVGVSPKGQGYGGGLITEPISVYFKASQMVVFRIQIPHAMNLYRGVHGHFPKSHQEFMEKIIQENGIQLPTLPPGARYVYDPQKAAQMQQYDPADPPLFVERPAP